MLAISLLTNVSDRVYLIDGSGQHRRIVKLKSLVQNSDFREWLIGFHAFTGNDFVSSFFNHGKKIVFEFLLKNEKYLQVFKQLGDSLSQEEILKNLAEIEQFICALYKTPKKYTEFS